MHEGVNQLMKHHHIDIYNGIGRIMGTSIFSPQSTISVEYEDGESDIPLIKCAYSYWVTTVRSLNLTINKYYRVMIS